MTKQNLPATRNVNGFGVGAMRMKLFFTVTLILVLVITVPGVAADEPTTYTVQPGDSLIRIAEKFGVTVPSLVTANQTTYPCITTQPTCLQIGWELAIPNAIVPTQAATQSTVQNAPDDSNAFWEMRMAIAGEVNRLRVENGLSTLSWNDTVASAAEQRSQDMVSRNYFSHFDPATGAIAAAQLLPGSIYSPACENIYGSWGRDAASVVSTAINLWWNSPGHKQCIRMPKVTVIGVGIAQDSKGGWLVTLINAKLK
jgi:uncharacterized protein YkwD